MGGNILTEVSHLLNTNMSFLEHFLYLKGSNNICHNLTYVNTGFYKYKYDINKSILYENIKHLEMVKRTVFHPLNVWHMQFTLNNQTQGFGILTNLTSHENLFLNTYYSSNNYFVDNPMIIFEENRILDFLKHGKRFEANTTLNESIEEYRYELYKRLYEPNRNYLHLELYNNLPHKHKLLHFLQ
jgi:hypothetical protein